MVFDPLKPITSAKLTIIEYLESKESWINFIPDHPRGTLPNPLEEPYVSFNQGQIITKSVALGDFLGESYDELNDQVIERTGKLAVISYPIDVWVGMSVKAGGPIERDHVIERLFYHFELKRNDFRALGIVPKRFSVGRSSVESDEQSEADSSLEILKTQCRLEVEVMIYDETLHEAIEGIDLYPTIKE